MAVVVCPSVSPSACPVPDRNSRLEGHRELKTGKKEAHDTHLEIEMSKVADKPPILCNMQRRGRFL